MNQQATALSYPLITPDLLVVPDAYAPSTGSVQRRSSAAAVTPSRVVPQQADPAVSRPAMAPQRLKRYKNTASRWQRAEQLAICGLMVFGLLHAGNSVWTGIQRLVSLVQHREVIQQFDQALTHKNTTLKKDIERYASPTGVEELARNQLEWVGQDEILVRTRP